MVEVRPLESVGDLARVEGLFASIWGASTGMHVNLLRALTHSGHYVAGAFDAGAFVGASVGFLGHEEDGLPVLHSHITGVARTGQGRGVGLAVKLHQRGWARERGIGTIAWTFDPLVRRNAWFNLAKLGARAVAYHPDFYGPMEDELNGKDDSDRCLVHWDTDPTRSHPATSADRAPIVLLEVGSGGRPLQRPTIESLPSGEIGCQVPADIEGTRRTNPALAREWRMALRVTMGELMDSGYAATTITKDGWYRLERTTP